eukprot:gnl/TRDRNA2_/TRDRNA2_164964_c0_seq4.p1 gnl/TRDRNA2_/TRDRNA2_164964_c0~~gnl/TRDRNA2_/TRDRNA2_164964_c0_seq4.p1  ORF type:complete len:388 (+),score=68.49 gnl/TRDRNA2_/TRDRNA2_164964_c0_seq4:72-1235(+)
MPVPRAGYSIVDRSTGAYVPGTGPHSNSATRKRFADQLFQQHPHVLEEIMQHPTSRKFHLQRALNYEDRLLDGFTARFSRELLYVDMKSDDRLRSFVRSVEVEVDDVHSIEAKVLAVAQMVSEAFGGQPSRHNHVEQRLSHIIEKSGKQKYERFPIGMFLASGDEAGAGICRHRSVLFKYVLDALRITPSAVFDGVMLQDDVTDVTKFRRDNMDTKGPPDHMWNVVSIRGKAFVIDVMNNPFELMDDKAIEEWESRGGSYHRIGGKSGRSVAVRKTVQADFVRQCQADFLLWKVGNLHDSGSFRGDDIPEESEESHEETSIGKFGVGDVVEMFSDGSWEKAIVEHSDRPGYVKVRFVRDKRASDGSHHLCQKHIRVDSNNLRSIAHK